MKRSNIKTKKLKRVNDKTLIVAVDISKRTHVGYCRCPGGIEVKPFPFVNDARGFREFWKGITQTMRTHTLEEIVVGIESTGAYAEPLLHYLKNRNVKVVQVNPMHTKRMKELQGNSPNKTDQKDPKIIADILELGHALTVVIPEGTAAELRRLSHARERGIERRVAVVNQLQGLVGIIFPEFLPIMKRIKSKSAKYLLKNHPTPDDIVGIGPEALSMQMRKISHGRLGRERAEELYHAARESIGVKEGLQSIILEIKECLSSIEASECFISEIEKRMSYYLQQIPYSRYILSIKGISEVTAAGLIGEFGDLRKFSTISEAIKLAGLDLYEISSGNHKGNKRISKRGRALLRKLLFFASINVVRKDGILHKQYQTHLDKGMIRMKALIAISRKLMGIIFALVRDHSVYIENYSKIQYQLKEVA